MKKLTLLAAMAFTLSLSAQTTNMGTGSSNEIKTPSSVNTKFTTEYPSMSPTWTMDGTNYRAQYMDGTTSHYITYDKNGDMISRGEVVPTGYPVGINDYYQKNHPNETYEVWTSWDAKGNQTYYTTYNNEMYWFDNTGKYKSKSKTTPTKK